MSIAVSIIIPIYNGSQWIDKCFENIVLQTCISVLNIEICVYDDNSIDNTSELLLKWKEIFHKKGILMNIANSTSIKNKGVGYAKNKAVHISTGEYLCFQDIDDFMLPNRILHQYNTACIIGNNYIIGSKFKRQPANSTTRYTSWANNLTKNQLNLQIYTANGPTVIMPTWFLHRSVFNRVGGFSEEGDGTPEDLLFFYTHLDLGGKIFRVDECLLIYNYHMHATTHSIHEDTIWSLRVQRLEAKELQKWSYFTIWNAGKQGRKLYKSLSSDNQQKVIAMCDVDKNKIGKSYIPYDPVKRKNRCPIKIIHFREATPPIIICVKMGLTHGQFEENLLSLNLKEGLDYIYFS